MEDHTICNVDLVRCRQARTIVPRDRYISRLADIQGSTPANECRKRFDLILTNSTPLDPG